MKLDAKETGCCRMKGNCWVEADGKITTEWLAGAR